MAQDSSNSVRGDRGFGWQEYGVQSLGSSNPSTPGWIGKIYRNAEKDARFKTYELFISKFSV